MVMFSFSVYDQKYPFCINLVQKFELSVHAKIWYLDEFIYAEFIGSGHFLCFKMKIPFLGKFSQNHIDQFQLKFGT